jgi:magnesium chelatase family protein
VYVAAQRQLDYYMHGCPCGYYGDPRRACSCAPGAIGRYQKRISGPLLDRSPAGRALRGIQERVDRTRAIRATLCTGTTLLTNVNIGPKELRQYAALHERLQPFC